jgi:hypothetical protein
MYEPNRITNVNKPKCWWSGCKNEATSVKCTICGASFCLSHDGQILLSTVIRVNKLGEMRSRAAEFCVVACAECMASPKASMFVSCYEKLGFAVEDAIRSFDALKSELLK